MQLHVCMTGSAKRSDKTCRGERTMSGAASRLTERGCTHCGQLGAAGALSMYSTRHALQKH